MYASEDVTIKAKELFSLAEVLFEQGQQMRFTITGNSMYPFMRHRTDEVTLAAPDYSKLKKGMIVLALRDNGQFVLHRIVKLKKAGFYMIGDAQTNLDGPYRPDQLKAIVTGVFRRGDEITHSIKWRIASTVWRWIVPLRPLIIKTRTKMAGGKRD